MPTLKETAGAQTDPALEVLRALIRRPSVAATGEGLIEAAALVRRTFEQTGARVMIATRDGAAPAVIADLPGAGDRTLLFYDHYDVQPPDPLNEWTWQPPAGRSRYIRRRPAPGRCRILGASWDSLL